MQCGYNFEKMSNLQTKEKQNSQNAQRDNSGRKKEYTQGLLLGDGNIELFFFLSLKGNIF